MSNGKLQKNKKENVEVRKGRIQLGLQRTLSTEKYQSIVIFYHIDEEITWEKLDERQNKVMNWSTVLTSEFKKIHDKVLEELNLSHKRAYFKDHLEERDDRPDPNATCDDLDELDPLD